MKQTGSVKKNERIVSLLIHLGQKESSSSRKEIEDKVEGYDGLGSHNSAACKTLERDLETLHELGARVRVLENGNLMLDAESTFSKDFFLEPEDVIALNLASIIPLDDPSFIYDDELKSAITKISGSLKTPGFANLACLPNPDKSDDKHATEYKYVKKLEDCRIRRKRVSFTYIKSSGEKDQRVVEPLGLFSIGQDWYLVGWDINLDQEREFRVSRMADLKERTQATEPEFASREFNVQDHIEFSFSFGYEEPFDVALLIPAFAKRSPSYVWDKATLFQIPGQNDRLLMLATARSTQEVVRWALEYAPDTLPLSPQKVVDAYFDGLKQIEVQHG